MSGEDDIIGVNDGAMTTSRSQGTIGPIGRITLWLALVVAWMVMVAYMWDAVTTIPSADRLAESHLIVIPGARSLVTAVTVSAIELVVVLAVLWPGRGAFWATRLAATAVGLVTWFIATTPLRDLSRMDWVHRRWLAFMVLAMAVSLVVTLMFRLALRVVAGGRV
jgi:hypothetical protein